MLTWGASEYVDQASGVGDGKFTLSLQFPGKEYENEDTTAFLKNIKALEDKIKADALVYSKEWFGKVHKSAEVVEALWTPMLKYSKDKATGNYDLTKSPALRIKLPQWKVYSRLKFTAKMVINYFLVLILALVLLII